MLHLGQVTVQFQVEARDRALDLVTVAGLEMEFIELVAKPAGHGLSLVQLSSNCANFFP